MMQRILLALIWIIAFNNFAFSADFSGMTLTGGLMINSGCIIVGDGLTFEIRGTVKNYGSITIDEGGTLKGCPYGPNEAELQNIRVAGGFEAREAEGSLPLYDGIGRFFRIAESDTGTTAKYVNNGTIIGDVRIVSKEEACDGRSRLDAVLKLAEGDGIIVDGAPGDDTLLIKAGQNAFVPNPIIASFCAPSNPSDTKRLAFQNIQGLPFSGSQEHYGGEKSEVKFDRTSAKFLNGESFFKNAPMTIQNGSEVTFGNSCVDATIHVSRNLTIMGGSTFDASNCKLVIDSGTTVTVGIDPI